MSNNFYTFPLRPRTRVKRTIHILGSSSQATFDAQSAAFQAVDKCTRPVEVDFDATYEAARRGHPVFSGAAVLIFLTQDACRNAAFVKAMEAAFSALERWPDIRLFIASAEMDRGEFDRLADAGDPLFGRIRDLVHLTDSLSVDDVVDSLVEHFERLDDVRDAAFWRFMRAHITVFLGGLAHIVERLSFLAMLTLAGLIVFRPGLLPVDLENCRVLLALCCGSICFWTNTVFLYVLLRGGREQLLLSQLDRSIGPSIALGFIATAIALPIQIWIAGMWSWFWLGAAAGVSLESLRRSTWRALQFHFDVTTDPRGYPRSLVRRLGEHMRPFQCPFWPPTQHSVVISYARGSRWSRGVADRLQQALKRAKVATYLDRESIGVGDSWSRHLREGVSRSTLFVSILDSYAVERKVVVAELAGAVASHGRCGCPHIVMIQGDDLLKATAPPLVREVMNVTANPVSPAGSVRVLDGPQFNPDVFAATATALRFRPNSLVPSRTAAMAEMILRPLTLLSAASGLVGYLAWLVFGFTLWKPSVLAGLTTTTASIAALLLAYWAGSCLRLAAETWFRVRTDQPHQLGAQHFTATCGLVALWWQIHVAPPAIIHAWCAVVFLLGWWRTQNLLWYGHMSEGQDSLRNID